MMTYYIYLIKNLINGKVYFGKTNDPNKRWNFHKWLAANKKLPFPLYRSISKHGIENFIFEIIEEHFLEQDALDAEIFFISYHRSLGARLYNITGGGEGTSGYYHSDETKRKISSSNIGKHNNRIDFNHSDESKTKISKALSGKLYSKIRKDLWYKNTFNQTDPVGLSGVEKLRTPKSEQFKGIKGPNVKLTEDQVKQIKQLIKNGLSNRTIAVMFGVGKSAIGDISSGRCWSHIKI